MKISLAVITYNEEARLGEALESAAGVADETVVLDSFSSDATRRVAESHGARFVQRRFDDYGSQKEAARELAGHQWVLNLDADERLSPELRAAILALKEGPEPAVDGFLICRRTFYLGRWVRHSGWYPDRKLRLFRKDRARWRGRIHERLELDGRRRPLPGDILHVTYSGIADHLARLNRYTSLQAEEIAASKQTLLLARTLLLPPITFLERYLIKLGWLDGFPGLVIALISSWATALKFLKARAIRRGFREETPAP
jgi:glycosyltransferase involved in cell wall biosynthesis